MKPEYSELIKDASFQELFRARWILLGRRNLAIAVAIVATLVIVWRGWSLWILFVPALIWLAAAGQHFHIKLIDIEFKRRKDAADESERTIHEKGQKLEIEPE